MNRTAILFLFLLNASPTQTKPVMRHSGLVVSLGQTAAMKCLAQCHIKDQRWTFIAYGSRSAPVTLYSDEIGLSKTAERVKVNIEADGNLALNIASIQLQDAGLYSCKTVCINATEKYDILEEATDLVILEGQPRCLSNVSETANEGETIQMVCDVIYRGNWDPVVLLGRQNEHDVTTVEGGIQTNATSNVSTTTTSMLTVLASYRTNKAVYTCSPQFTHYAGEVTSTITFLPSYRGTCTWPPLNITYGPRDLKIFPQRSSLFVGEELTCSADANPAAEYEWKDLERGYVVGGAIFKLEESMTSRETIYLLCKATNELSNSTLPANVTVTANRALSVQVKIVLVIVPTVILLVTLVVVVYLVQSRRAGSRSGCKEAKDGVENPDPIESTSSISDRQASDSASYSSIPSVVVAQQLAAEDVANAVESSPANPKRNTDRYIQLGPREIPPPATYSQLQKKKQPYIPDTVIKQTETEYFNVDNSPQSDDDYYNIRSSKSFKTHQR